MRTKVRAGDVSGTGGSWSEGQITPLNKEQQKLWDATMADEVGKWEDYPKADRETDGKAIFLENKKFILKLKTVKY